MELASRRPRRRASRRDQESTHAHTVDHHLGSDSGQPARRAVAGTTRSTTRPRPSASQARRRSAVAPRSRGGIGGVTELFRGQHPQRSAASHDDQRFAQRQHTCAVQHRAQRLVHDPVVHVRTARSRRWTRTPDCGLRGPTTGDRDVQARVEQHAQPEQPRPPTCRTARRRGADRRRHVPRPRRGARRRRGVPATTRSTAPRPQECQVTPDGAASPRRSTTAPTSAATTSRASRLHGARSRAARPRRDRGHDGPGHDRPDRNRAHDRLRPMARQVVARRRSGRSAPTAPPCRLVRHGRQRGLGP